jgi:hypothetical protein
MRDELVATMPVTAKDVAGYRKSYRMLAICSV